MINQSCRSLMMKIYVYIIDHTFNNKACYPNKSSRPYARVDNRSMVYESYQC